MKLLLSHRFRLSGRWIFRQNDFVNLNLLDSVKLGHRNKHGRVSFNPRWFKQRGNFYGEQRKIWSEHAVSLKISRLARKSVIYPSFWCRNIRGNNGTCLSEKRREREREKERRLLVDGVNFIFQLILPAWERFSMNEYKATRRQICEKSSFRTKFIVILSYVSQEVEITAGNLLLRL